MAAGESGLPQLRKRLFGKYDRNEVDLLVADLHKKIRKLTRENVALVASLEKATKELDSYREEKDYINRAVSIVDEIRRSYVEAAQKEADEIIRAAESQSKDLVANFSYEVMEQKDRLLKLRSCVDDFQNSVLFLLRDAFELLKSFAAKDVTYAEMCAKVFSEVDRMVEDRDIESSSGGASSVDVGEGSEVDLVSDSEKVGNTCGGGSGPKEKFKDLKFGDNYIPQATSGKSFSGLFKKVR